MGYKIKHILKKSKPVFIAIIVLWLLFTFLLIPPFTVANVRASTEGYFNFGVFIEELIGVMGSWGENISTSFSSGYIGTYFRLQGYVILILAFAAVVGMVKSAPKHEYADVEHGSSDWAENGEQYKILSPKEGILLAEKNYLPIDKRGNVNVLIVGRIGFTENLLHMLYQTHIKNWDHTYSQIPKVKYMTKRRDI